MSRVDVFLHRVPEEESKRLLAGLFSVVFDNLKADLAVFFGLTEVSQLGEFFIDLGRNDSKG